MGEQRRKRSGPKKKATRRPGEQTQSCPAWAEQIRRSFEAAGDTYGVTRLAALLLRLRPTPEADVTIRLPGIGDVTAVARVLTADDVLRWAEHRAAALGLVAALRPAIDHPADTDADRCARWRALAAHVPRFDGDPLPSPPPGQADVDGRRSPLPYSPARQWAEAFRDATHALRPLAQALGIERLERVVQLERELRGALSQPGRLLQVAALADAVALVVEVAEGIGKPPPPPDPLAVLAADPTCVRIAKALAGGALTPKALRARSGASERTTGDRLQRMRDAGWIAQGRPRMPYTLTDAGRSALLEA